MAYLPANAASLPAEGSHDLSQITPENVSPLQVAWTYDTRDGFPGSEMQSNPVIQAGVPYALSPKQRAFCPRRLIAGWDPQLERAVAEALRPLKANPGDRMMTEPAAPTRGKRKR